MTAQADVRVLVESIRTHEAWAIIRRKASPTVGLLGGAPSKLASLLEIPLEHGLPAPGRSADRLVAVPFRQVRERGFEMIDDGAPLVVVDVQIEHEVAVDDLLRALPDVPLTFIDRGDFGINDADYEMIVKAIIADEIGQGEGANLVIGRHYRAQVKDWDGDRALTVLRRLLAREKGAYWTYVFFTGERYLIGATPERHVSVMPAGNEQGTSERRGQATNATVELSDVRMNPISGTFRVGHQPLPANGSALERAQNDLKQRLLSFLADQKEIFELFMVVDEELKMMCQLCHEGGQVLGPFLKPMTHLIHTEYLLAGRSARDPREILRDSMFAATVTGAPVENACRLISKYEQEGRGYYASALALFGRDANGRPTMDSPILIRTADVDLDGNLTITAGATLVRDSDAAYEVAETYAKAGGILSAFGLVEFPSADGPDPAALARDEDVLLALGTRNQRLSRFWITSQSDTPVDTELVGKRVVILHGQDDFVNMLRHTLEMLGMTSTIVRHEDYRTGAFDGADLVVIGPGPGDPRDGGHPKIAVFRQAVDDMLASSRPFLAVCLGHQVLCERLGIPLEFKEIVFQGTQSPVRINGRTERVGFYNTFVGRAVHLPVGVSVEADPNTGDIHMVRGPHYIGIQFHAESILTERGFELTSEIVRHLLL